MRSGRALFLVLASLIAGCQQPNIRETTANLRGAEVCCQTAAQFPFETIEPDKELTANLTPESPAFLFPEGKRYFTAIALPAWEGPMQVTLYTGATAGIGSHSAIVRPRVQLYDAAYQPTRNIAADMETDWNSGRFEMTFFINDSDRAERYFAVYAEDADGAHGRDETQYQPVQVGYPLLIVPVTVGASTKTHRHVFAPIGPMRIKLRQYRPVHADAR